MVNLLVLKAIFCCKQESCMRFVLILTCWSKQQFICRGKPQFSQVCLKSCDKRFRNGSTLQTSYCVDVYLMKIEGMFLYFFTFFWALCTTENIQYFKELRNYFVPNSGQAGIWYISIPWLLLFKLWLQIIPPTWPCFILVFLTSCLCTWISESRIFILHTASHIGRFVLNAGILLLSHWFNVHNDIISSHFKESVFRHCGGWFCVIFLCNIKCTVFFFFNSSVLINSLLLL